MRQPMATELIQLAVGDYQAIDRGRHGGLPIRDVIAPSLAGLLADKLPPRPSTSTGCRHGSATTRSTSTARSWSTPLLGFALETQTLSLYDRGWFDGTYGPGAGDWEPTMVHELAHMWFGDSVSPVRVERPVAQRGPRDLVPVPFAAENGELEENTGIADFTEPDAAPSTRSATSGASRTARSRSR